VVVEHAGHHLGNVVLVGSCHATRGTEARAKLNDEVTVSTSESSARKHPGSTTPSSCTRVPNTKPPRLPADAQP